MIIRPNLEEVYETLRFLGYTTSKTDFSKNFLARAPSYLATYSCKGLPPSRHTLFHLQTQLKKLLEAEERDYARPLIERAIGLAEELGESKGVA